MIAARLPELAAQLQSDEDLVSYVPVEGKVSLLVCSTLKLLCTNLLYTRSRRAQCKALDCPRLFSERKGANPPPPPPPTMLLYQAFTLTAGNPSKSHLSSVKGTPELFCRLGGLFLPVPVQELQMAGLHLDCIQGAKHATAYRQWRAHLSCSADLAARSCRSLSRSFRWQASTCSAQDTPHCLQPGCAARPTAMTLPLKSEQVM